MTDDIRHNHMTRDIKPPLKCPKCDEHYRPWQLEAAKCDFIMFRGAFSGRTITCGACSHCLEADLLKNAEEWITNEKL